jgi:hypothetical protein
MPVGRKRRRAFWLFFLIVPLLLWWWIERGQGRASGPSRQSQIHATGSTHTKAPTASVTSTTSETSTASETPGTSASGSPVNRSSGSPANRASGNSPGTLPAASPSSYGTATPNHDRRTRLAPYPLHRAPARRDPRRPGLSIGGEKTTDLRRSDIDEQVATTASWNGIDVPRLHTERVRRNTADGKKANKQAKPASPAKTPPAASPKKEETRILFAAGLAASKSFPVGSQQVVDYNANLKKDIWFDYVPTPYFQYHPSRRVAFQAGLQFNSPQYTENVAIFRKAGPPIGAGSPFTQDTVLVVRKLYYFNFPLIAYYSPIRDLYLGVGIQYSNLRDGVALQNNVLHYTGSGGGQRDTVQSSKFVTLKDNAPAYGNLKKSDWRGLLELNYYWRKITLGLQFQESLGDYLRTPVEGSPGRDRNSSFNLYLRYNIWEKRVAVPARK